MELAQGLSTVAGFDVVTLVDLLRENMRTNTLGIPATIFMGSLLAIFKMNSQWGGHVHWSVCYVSQVSEMDLSDQVFACGDSSMTGWNSRIL
jgi:hypothetical protein